MARSRELKKISDLFQKYKSTLKAPEASVVKTFCEVVQDVCGITVKPEGVTYRPSTRVLALKRGGPVKQEILIHKKELLIHLQGRLGPTSAPTEII